MIAPVALLTATTSAQDLLDLDKPEAPDVGAKAAALTLAETLESQARLLETQAAASAGVRAEVRRLAAALLRAGHEAGDAGAPKLLAGRTIANHLGELDALAEGAWFDDVERLLVLGDLRRVHERIPPADEAMDRALRDAFWRLGERAEAPQVGIGWVEAGPADDVPGEAARDAASLLRSLGAYEETMTQVDRLLDLADEAASRTSFAPAGERVRALLVGATATLHDPPRWIEDKHLESGVHNVSRAAAAMLDPSDREEGRDRLARYAALAGLVRRADALGRGNDVRAFRESLSEAVGSPPPRATLDALTQALDLFDAVGTLDRDEKTLVRQLRPAWRWARRAGVLAGRSLGARLAPIAQTNDPLTDPGVLSDFAAARAPLDLAAALVALSDRLDQDEHGPADRPEASGVHEGVADLVLKASADLGDSEEGARARALIMRINDDLARAGALGAIAEPRLAPAAASARDAMLHAWAQAGGDPDAARLGMARVERVARWIEDAAAAERVERGGSLVQAWAGFELSREAAGAVRRDIDRWTERLLANTESGDAEAVDGLLSRMDREHAAVAVVGALERRLRTLTALERADDAWGVIAEIGHGPPDGSRAWLVDQRGRLAALCARAEELAAATIRDDRPAASDLLDALNTTARPLLRAVEGR